MLFINSLVDIHTHSFNAKRAAVVFIQIPNQALNLKTQFTKPYLLTLFI